jgi:hypothetical protein
MVIGGTLKWPAVEGCCCFYSIKKLWQAAERNGPLLQQFALSLHTLGHGKMLK